MGLDSAEVAVKSLMVSITVIQIGQNKWYKSRNVKAQPVVKGNGKTDLGQFIQRPEIDKTKEA